MRKLLVVLGALLALVVAQQQQQQENIQVVRVSETLYVPWSHPTQSASAGNSLHAPHHSHSHGHVKRDQAPASSNNNKILTTAHYSKTIKPLLIYLVQHPVRALRRYIIPYAVYLIVRLAVNIYRGTLYSISFLFHRVLVPVVRPAKSIFRTFVVAPFESLLDLVLAWTPVWTFLGFALMSGGCMGAMAGWLTRSDKPSKDQWVDLVNDKTSVQARRDLARRGRKLGEDALFGAGARLEKMRSGESSSSKRSSSVKSKSTGKGKERMIETSSVDDMTTTTTNSDYNEDDNDDTATLRPSMMGSSGRMLSHLRFGESDAETDD